MLPTSNQQRLRKYLFVHVYFVFKLSRSMEIIFSAYETTQIMIMCTGRNEEGNFSQNFEIKTLKTLHVTRQKMQS